MLAGWVGDISTHAVGRNQKDKIFLVAKVRHSQSELVPDVQQHDSAQSTSNADNVDNKWKNHFYKMKGDVGMSGHEKERKQEDAYTKIQTHS